MKRPKKLQTAFETYVVGRQLGQGGAGYVYQISDSSGRESAAKILDPSKATKDRLKRFRNEFQFCSISDHVNIVPAKEYGLTDTGAPFFTMPLFSSSLRAVIGKLSASQAVEVFAKILNGVEVAHIRGVVHRDLKPENILLKDELQDIAVADFGIARFIANDLFTAVETKDDSRLANFQYAAPEQRQRGSSIDSRADIYALGLILNELFTGKLAIGTNYRTIASVEPKYSFLDEIVERMLAQDPSDRFPDIQRLKRELGARKVQFIEEQKLDQLRNKVVPEQEIIDPLILDPPRIIDHDWDSNVLKLQFQQSLNAGWLHALNNMGGWQSTEGSEPHTVRIQGDWAFIPATSRTADQVLEHFKRWVPHANAVYKMNVETAMERERTRKKREIEAEIAAVEERKRVLERLSL